MCVCACVCVCAGMWCLVWETQQEVCSVALQSDRVGREEGQAVITNSIHFRNNNTALRVNRGLFSFGSHWSARAKNSTNLLSLAVTSQDEALAQPSLDLLSSHLHSTHMDSLAHAHVHIFRKVQCMYFLVNLEKKRAHNLTFKWLKCSFRQG